MADPDEVVAEGDPPTEPGDDAPRERTFVDASLDFLFPSGSFKGPDAKANLAGARCIMCVFYVAYTGVLLFILYQLVFSGKIEVYETTYKFDQIEAPSFAICPFSPSVNIEAPFNESLAERVQAKKYNRGGFLDTKILSVDPFFCDFDHTCVCVDYFSSPSGTQYFADRAMRRGGDKNKRDANFRDRIEVKTNLTDASGERALKVGLYDKTDQSPEWFYVGQGEYVLGTVEMSEWIIHDYSLTAIWKTLHGDWTAMFSQRHMFHFTGTPVGQAINQTENQTIFSYEMKDFFVQATMSSSSTISLFTLGYLALLIAIRSAVVGIFIQIMFPEYDPKKNEVKVRELSGTSDCIMTFCCWCCRRRGRSEESEPLLGAEGGAEAPEESST